MSYQGPNWQRLRQMEWDKYQAALLIQQANQYNRDLAEREKVAKREQRHHREVHLFDLFDMVERAMRVYEFAQKVYNFKNEHPELNELGRDAKLQWDKAWDVWTASSARQTPSGSSETSHHMSRTGQSESQRPGRPTSPASHSRRTSEGETGPAVTERGIQVIREPGGKYRSVGHGSEGRRYANGRTSGGETSPAVTERGIQVIREPDGKYRSVARSYPGDTPMAPPQT